MSVKSPINEFKVKGNSPPMTHERRCLLILLPPHMVLEVRSGLRQSCIINKGKKLKLYSRLSHYLNSFRQRGFGKILLFLLKILLFCSCVSLDKLFIL